MKFSKKTAVYTYTHPSLVESYKVVFFTSQKNIKEWLKKPVNISNSFYPLEPGSCWFCVKCVGGGCWETEGLFCSNKAFMRGWRSVFYKKVDLG